MPHSKLYARIQKWITNLLTKLFRTILNLFQGKRSFLDIVITKILKRFRMQLLKCLLNLFYYITANPEVQPLGLINIGYFTKEQCQLSKDPRLKPLSHTFAQLLKTMQSRSISPKRLKKLLFKLKKCVGQLNPSFKTPYQQDALEFLKSFLECVHTELNEAPGDTPYKKLKTQIEALDSDSPVDYNKLSQEWISYMGSREYSIVTNIFSGQLLHEARCTRCSFHSVTFESYWDLSLGFNIEQKDKHHKLEVMLKKFMSEEFIVGKQEICGCQSQNTLKIQTLLWDLPKVLIIHLKRFKCDDDGAYNKLENIIEFPVNCLDMREFIKESRRISISKTKYKLVGIVNHVGTLTSGHFSALCLDPRDKKWYNYDDSEREEVLKMRDIITSHNAYLLFYINTAYVKPVSTDIEALD